MNSQKVENYDSIQGFEYWNPEAWKHYVTQIVAPIDELTAKLLGLREYVSRAVGTEGKVSVADIEKIDKDLLVFLLGGIKEDCNYGEKSIAKFFKLAFGIFLSPKEWVTLEKEEGISSKDYVKVRAEGTDFSNFLAKVQSVTKNILSPIGLVTHQVNQQDVRELVQTPEKLVETVLSLYRACLEACVNQSYYALFARGTRALHWRAMLSAYPKIKGNFGELRDFLSLDRIYEPKVNAKEKVEEYSLWTHKKGGIAEGICSLNEAIWDGFASQMVGAIFQIVGVPQRNLRADYARMISSKLEEIKWKFPENIRMTDREWYTKARDKGVYRYSYIISGSLLTKEKFDGLSWRGNWNSSESEVGVSLFKLLDDLAPALVLGSDSFQLRISGDELEFIRGV